MGQGRKNKIRESNDAIKFQQRIEKTGDTSQSMRNEVAKHCVDFDLEDCTQLAERVNPDDSIFGDFSEPRIVIFSDEGVIGYAPVRISKKILLKVAALSTRVFGRVVTFRPPRAVKVEICV